MAKMNKIEFVGKVVKPMAMAIDNDITEVTYETEYTFVDDKPKYYEEFVTITFDNVYKRRVNVSGDSLKAIVADVLKVLD